MTQFELPQPVLRNIKAKNPSMLALRDMEAGELGDLVHNFKMGSILYKLIGNFLLLILNRKYSPLQLM